MSQLGYIVWSGASALDGAPVMLVMTGIGRASRNTKTGAVVQTWILRSDVDPVAAVRLGRDESVCGDCALRGRVAWSAFGATGRVGRTCYVNVGRAPAGVFRAAKRGVYARVSPSVAALALRGRVLRIGSYGDPAAVPAAVWETLARAATRHVGYTHQWRTAPALRALAMASVDSESEAMAARALGWRTFRVRAVRADGATEPLQAGPGRAVSEVPCPASDEAGKRTTCERCSLCAGASVRARNVAIIDHSASARGRRRLTVLQEVSHG